MSIVDVPYGCTPFDNLYRRQKCDIPTIMFTPLVNEAEYKAMQESKMKVLKNKMAGR